VRAPAVTVALLIILALGFGTAAIADDGGKSGGGSSNSGGGSSNSGQGNGTTPTTPTTPASATTTTKTGPQGAAIGNGKPKPEGTGNDGTPGAEPDPTATRDAAHELAAAAPPVVGQSAAVTPVSGDVQVKLPGRDDYVALGEAASVPLGTTLDATKGKVRLTSAHDAKNTPQSANFTGGVFKVTGQTTGAKPITNLVLTGGDFDAACGKAAFAFAKHPPVRQLWGSGHGRFKTRGRYSAATVRGTIWLTRDTCDGTLTIVKRGVVAVRDQVRKKTVMVRAGHTYFARAPLPVNAATKLLGF
jgi:hypothetical protein